MVTSIFQCVQEAANNFNQYLGNTVPENTQRGSISLTGEKSTGGLVESMKEPDGVADDIWWESVTPVRIHAPIPAIWGS